MGEQETLDDLRTAVVANCRPEVLAFACAMEEQLKANDHKGDWRQEHPRDLMERLREEAEELHDTMLGRIRMGGKRRSSARDVLLEAADVANFAMMVADVCGSLVPYAAGVADLAAARREAGHRWARS